jgi:outer membrane phospholipase A
MKPHHFVLLSLLCSDSPVVFATPGSGAVYSLVAPADRAGPGATVSFELAVLNPTPAAVSFDLPATLPGRLSGPGGPWPVTVHAGAAPISARTVAPGGFALVPLSFTLPVDATGALLLELDRPAPLRLPLTTSARTTPKPTVELVATQAPASLIERRTAAAHIKNYYAGNFAPHEPLYFIYGPDAPAAKFQVSFKYRLPLDDGWLARRLPQMRGMHLAFTQRSLWDIRGLSSPFYDTSYMPELLYQFAAKEPDRPGAATWLGWSGGIQHESNGKKDDDSRSFNIAYLRTALALGDLDRWHLIVTPRVFTYVGDRFDNPNIGDYRGWGDVRLVFGRNDGPAFSVYARAGRGFRRGALQADLTVPTSVFSGSFATYLHIQYWTGFGESLLHYNRRTDTVRAGFSLVR